MALVSVVVVGWRRPAYLRRTVETFLAETDYPDIELILADDGSPREQQVEMLDLPFDRFVLSAENRGLGANNNNGLRAAKGDYILHLQDDWECVGPPSYLADAVAVLDARPDIEVVRFTPMSLETSDREAGMVGALEGGTPERVATTPLVVATSASFGGTYLYSDHPHLKRSTLHDEVGYFDEVPGGGSERGFCGRFRSRPGATVAWLEDSPEVFRHFGEVSFRPERRAQMRRQWLGRRRLGRVALAGYEGARRARNLVRGRSV